MHLTIYNFLGQQRSGKTVNKRKGLGQRWYLLQLLTQHHCPGYMTRG